MGVCVCVLWALTGGTAAAQASDSWADSSLPPSAPATAASLPNAAVPPRSPGTTRTSRDDALGSGDTDMASSAVVAAAGERPSPFFRRKDSGEAKDCGTSKISGPRHTYCCTLCCVRLLCTSCRRRISLSKECYPLFTSHVRLLK